MICRVKRWLRFCKDILVVICPANRKNFVVISPLNLKLQDLKFLGRQVFATAGETAD